MELKKLYKDRLRVELNLPHIKTTLGMDVLSRRTPQMVEKEIGIYLLAYNLIRILMAQSAAYRGCLPNQLSFNHTAQLWLAWGRHAEVGEFDSWIAQLTAISREHVGNRPGRNEPRQHRRRPKPFPPLKKSRSAARGDVIKYGHEKKRSLSQCHSLIE